jgi:hypothetical protein
MHNINSIEFIKSEVKMQNIYLNIYLNYYEL